MSSIDAEMTPEALSPRRRAQPVSTNLPFSLTWADLDSALEAPAPDRPDAARAYLVYEKAGRFQGSDSSVILTLRYPADEGAAERTVFVKQARRSGDREAAHYDFLRSVGVPTPDLLAVVDRDDQEVIVTEFLARIGVDLCDEDEVNEMLELLARLNAVECPPGRFVPGPGRPEAEMQRLRRGGIEALAADPRSEVEPERWLAAFGRTQGAVAEMSQALTHGEFSFQQCGWVDRSTGPALVLFDLATLARRPRLADLASVLGPCSRGTGLGEEDLMGLYLGALKRHGVSVPTVQGALGELRLYRIWKQFCAMHWLTHEVYEPGSDQLLQLAQELRNDLTAAGLR